MLGVNISVSNTNATRQDADFAGISNIVSVGSGGTKTAAGERTSVTDTSSAGTGVELVGNSLDVIHSSSASYTNVIGSRASITVGGTGSNTYNTNYAYTTV